MTTRYPLSFLCILFVAILLGGGCSQPAPPSDAAVVPVQGGQTPYFTPEEPPQFSFNDGVRIATLNAEFMFDGEGNEGEATFPHKGDPALARAHRDRIGEIIQWLDADVIMLAEIENERVLEMLVSESLPDQGYGVHFVQGADRFTGQNMGVLSRLPVEEVGRTDERAPVGATGDTYGVSKNMYVRLTLGEVPTTMIGVHFLARPDDASRKPRREAQAEVIRKLVVQEQAAGRAVVVLGDFNDFDDETLDIGGSQPITEVLQRIKAAGDGAEDDLHNVLADVPQVERFTSHYDRNDNGVVEEGELSAIDHILLSPELYRAVREVTYVQAHDPATHTDHFPIVVGLAVE